MENILIQTYRSPCGEMLIGTFENQLVLADWKYRKMRTSIDNRICKILKTNYKEDETDIHQLIIAQLEEYFNGNRKKFDLPIRLIGTDFQISVWQTLLQIPYGNTLSYLKLAQSMKSELAIRAIASANGANAISIIVPCHRIIGSNNDLIGYAGGLHTKMKLLQLENALPQLQINF